MQSLRYAKNISILEALENLGLRNMMIVVVIFIFALTTLISGFYNIYTSSKERAFIQGELNVKEFSKLYDEYLSTSLNTVKLASYAVDNMILNGDSNEIIGRYMTAESDNIKEAIADEYTGLYGFIRDEYIDGAGWVPDADFDPKSRPWYIETVSAGKKINFVRPYLDMQTNTVMMTISSLLSDQKSVVALDVSLGELQVITENIAKDCPGRLAFVLDDSGGVVAHTDKRQVEHNFIKETGTLGALIAKKIIDEGELRFEVTYGDITYIVYAEQLEDGWHCVAAMDIDEFYKTPRLITLVSFLVTITATLMFLMVIIRISKQHLFAKRMNRQLASVGSIYISMFDIDLKKNVFSEINNNIYTGYQKHSPASGNEAESGTADDKTAEIFNLPDELNHNKFKKMTDAQNNLIKIAEQFSDPNYHVIMRNFMNFETLKERLGSGRTVTEEFLDSSNRWCRARFIVSNFITVNGKNEIDHVLWLVENIDEEKRNRDELTYLAETDLMTGIKNRGTGESCIVKLIAAKQPGMFILLDADKFKSINDTYGHNVGDKVIISIADALKKTFRKADVIMRLGGDEFAVYAVDLDTRDKAEVVIQRLFQNIEAIDIPEMADRKVKISAGATFYNGQNAISFKTLYEQADNGTYNSKKFSGNRISYYMELKKS